MRISYVLPISIGGATICLGVVISDVANVLLSTEVGRRMMLLGCVCCSLAILGCSDFLGGFI